MKHNRNHVISIGSGRPPVSKCTCGWQTEPSTELLLLGTQAFAHRDATGHQLRRPEDKKDMPVIEVLE